MNYKEIHFEEIDSTNAYIKKHHKELEDFTFVSSDYQSNGKGRGGHNWTSDKGESVLISLLVKDKSIITYGGFLSLIVSLSAIHTIEKYLSDSDIKIKWPNDVYVNDKKICGILLEGNIDEYIAIGIGINVNQKSFNGDYRYPPTSIYLESKRNINIIEFKRDLMGNLINNLQNIGAFKGHCVEEFKAYNYLQNKDISFEINGARQTGKVIGVDQEFNLVVISNGKETKITSGEVNLVTLM